MIAPSITVRVNSARRWRSSAAGSRPGRVEAGLDGVDPLPEIDREQVANAGIGLVQLEREAADRAAIGAVGGDEMGAIAVQQGEDPLDRIVDARPGRLQQPLLDAVAIGFEHGGEHVLLAAVLEAYRDGIEQWLLQPGLGRRRRSGRADLRLLSDIAASS